VRREFEHVGLGYVLRVPDLMTELTVDRMARTRGELHGELAVVCGLPGTRSRDGHIHQARFNLTSTQARGTVAKVLARRSGAGDVDWEDLLEDLCRRVLAAEREGEPVQKVGALPVPVRETYRLDPLLPERQVSILYGDGGTGKSTLAAAMAVSIQTGAVVVEGWAPRKAPVLYLDWEAGAASINRRVRGVAVGAHIPHVVTIDHMDCRRRGPLHHFAEDVARLVDREGYGLVVVDSVGMASGTSGEGGDANETAVRLFAAFGYLGTTVLAIDHVNKSDAEQTNRTTRPYGSIYKGLLARALYELRRSKTPDGASVVGLYNTKANDADLLAPIALRVCHGDDGTIAYERREGMPLELTGPMTQADKLAAYLEGERLTDVQLADLTGLPANQVRAILNRHKRRFNRLPTGAWEVLSHAS